MTVEAPTANKEVRMTRKAILTELMALLLVTTGTAIPSNSTPATRDGKTQKRWTKIGTAFPYKEGLGFLIVYPFRGPKGPLLI
jgi:hypothetical protein